MSRSIAQKSNIVKEIIGVGILGLIGTVPKVPVKGSQSDDRRLSRQDEWRCQRKSTFFYIPLNPNPLHLIKRDLVARAVIELRRPRRLVPSDELRVFDRPAILQVRRNP